MLLASLVSSAVFVLCCRRLKLLNMHSVFISAFSDLGRFHFFFFQEFNSGVDQERRLVKLESGQTGSTEVGETLQR